MAKAVEKQKSNLMGKEVSVSESPKEQVVNSIAFQVGRVAFNKAVSLVTNGLPSKDFGDATCGILMSIDENHLKELTLCTNSIEVFVRTKVKLDQNGKAGSICPNGNIMSAVVGRLRTMKNPINVEYSNDTDVLNVTCGTEYDGKIAHYDTVGFYMPPTNDEIKEYPEMSIPIRLIRRALNEVAFAASKDKTNIQLTGIFFDQDSNGMNIVASDSLRISIIQYKSKINEPKSIVLSINHLELISKILRSLDVDDSEVIKLYISDDMAYFISENTTVGFQTYGNSYFDEYKQFVVEPSQCKIIMRFDRERFLNLLTLAMSHNYSSTDAIMLRLVDVRNGVFENVATSVSNSNAFSIPFDIKSVKKGAGEDKARKFSIMVNPQFIVDVLSKITSKEVDIGLIDYNDGPAAVFPVGDEITGKYLHVFSLTE